MDFTLPASSNPKNIIFCPVGMYVIDIGVCVTLKYSDNPNCAIPHSICANTDVFIVFATLRNTHA